MKPVRKLLGLLSAALLITVLVPTASAEVGPTIPKAIKGKQCVSDTSDMRRNHMDYLKKHRVEALREGIRTKQYSLRECLECHVPAKGSETTAESGQFCKNCHVYVGVKLDCFECHATQPDAPMDKSAWNHTMVPSIAPSSVSSRTPLSAVALSSRSKINREAEQ